MKRSRLHQSYVNLDKLRGKLTELKISYEQCAEAIGISKYQFSRKIKGDVPFWIDEVIEICIYLQLDKKETYTIFLSELKLDEEIA